MHDALVGGRALRTFNVSERGFTLRQFATGKFPSPGQMFTRGTLCNQYLAIMGQQGTCHNMNGRLQCTRHGLDQPSKAP